jgi:cell cycle checkpoint protein
MADVIFSCSIDFPKFFAQVLKVIDWRGPESQPCSVSVSSKGLLFLTEDTSVLEATVLLKATLFQSFTYVGPDDYDFRVNLTALVNCLNLFAETATSIEISVDQASDLRVQIFEVGSSTDCSIRTLHSRHDNLEQRNLSDAFTGSPVIITFVISSVVVREMFRFPNERKNKAVSIEMAIDPTARNFEVKAEGAYGVVRSAIAFTQPDFHQVKLNISERFTASYPVWSLTPVLDAMQESFETKFRFNSNGMLSVQQGIKGHQGSGIETAVEFILQPLEDDPGL